VSEDDSGTSTAVFNISLSAATHTATAQVTYATGDGSATTADADYNATTGTLSFGPGQTSKTVAVMVNGDVTFEPNETFLVLLSNATHAILADSQGGGTIANDDPEPAISVGDVSVKEGGTGTRSAVFTVSLSNPSSSPVSVSFATANATATTANRDYVAATGTITFAPNERTKAVIVSINGDYVIEPDETLFLNLANPTGGTIADGQGAATIQNDDTVASTIAALAAQVTGCTTGSTRQYCQTLLGYLATIEREIAAGRVRGVVNGLQLFIRVVETFSRPIPGSDRPPLVDPAAAAMWIAEAQSIIAALVTT
jgi:chitinase